MVDSYITVTYSSDEPGMFETKIVMMGQMVKESRNGSFRIIERKKKRFLWNFLTSSFLQSSYPRYGDSSTIFCIFHFYVFCCSAGLSVHLSGRQVLFAPRPLLQQQQSNCRPITGHKATCPRGAWECLAFLCTSRKMETRQDERVQKEVEGWEAYIHYGYNL